MHAHILYDLNAGSVLSVTPSHMIKSHDIACCGVAFSPCGQYLASGDLAGGVWIMQQDDIMPKYKCSVSTLEVQLIKTFHSRVS